jgi:hypothetical protein
MFREIDALIDFDKVIENSIRKLYCRWKGAISYGWYPGEHTPVNLRESTLSNAELLSLKMISRIDDKLNLIQSTLISAFPHRKEILETAFYLHNENMYIASIPLLLSQAEGIFSEGFTKSFYSRRNDKRNKIKSVLNEELGEAFNLFMSQTLNSNEFGQTSSRNEPSHKLLGPNRNGILHGEKGHLDYGTKVNSYKAISLISYVGWMVTIYIEPTHKT